MKRLSQAFIVAASLLVLTASGLGAGFKNGKNRVVLRGQQQDVYYVAGSPPTAAQRPAVLFLPGDRGWAGKAVDMGQMIASWGYDVFGVDTNTYLTSFTGPTTLTEPQIVDDLLRLSDVMAPQRRVVLVGWSEGAGIVALAASGDAGKQKYAGVVVFGLSDKNVIAWRLKDNLSILTQREPNEPTFSVMPHLASVSPTPFAMLRADKDQFVSSTEAQALYEAAREPKRYVEVDAENHRFDGNDEEFYKELKESIEWALKNSK